MTTLDVTELEKEIVNSKREILELGYDRLESRAKLTEVQNFALKQHLVTQHFVEGALMLLRQGNLGSQALLRSLEEMDIVTVWGIECEGWSEIILWGYEDQIDLLESNIKTLYETPLHKIDPKRAEGMVELSREKINSLKEEQENYRKRFSLRSTRGRSRIELKTMVEELEAKLKAGPSEGVYKARYRYMFKGGHHSVHIWNPMLFNYFVADRAIGAIHIEGQAGMQESEISLIAHTLQRIFLQSVRRLRTLSILKESSM